MHSDKGGELTRNKLVKTSEISSRAYNTLGRETRAVDVHQLNRGPNLVCWRQGKQQRSWLGQPVRKRFQISRDYDRLRAERPLSGRGSILVGRGRNNSPSPIGKHA